jgi:dienelactone hydrolase
MRVWTTIALGLAIAACSGDGGEGGGPSDGADSSAASDAGDTGGSGDAGESGDADEETASAECPGGSGPYPEYAGACVGNVGLTDLSAEPCTCACDQCCDETCVSASCDDSCLGEQDADSDADTADDTADAAGACEGPETPEGAVWAALDVELEAADGKKIAATLHAPSDSACMPAALLLHQFQLSKAQWGDSLSAFTEAGLVVLAIDLRGHGASDAQDGPLAGLLNDPTQAPQDVAAAMEYLARAPQVDPSRIAVVGTSIGANLSIVAMTLEMGAKAVAALSPRMDPILSLAGSPTDLELTDVFCVAGAQDSGGDQAKTCQDLVAAASGNAEAVVLPDTAAHGVAVLEQFPDVLPQTVLWLKDVL